MSGRRGFWMAPRELAELLEDGILTATQFALVVYVGTAAHEDEGIAASLDLLAGLLGCSPKTVQRALAATTALGLLRSDLRQGQRTPFRLRLGPAALVVQATSDTDPSRDVRSGVRSHFGQDEDSELLNPALDAVSGDGDFGPSRARAETETETEKNFTVKRRQGSSSLSVDPQIVSLIEAIYDLLDQKTLRDGDGQQEDVRVRLLRDFGATLVFDDFLFVHGQVCARRREEDRDPSNGDPPEPLKNDAAWVYSLLQGRRNPDFGRHGYGEWS